MNERWVCKRCFADNEETNLACARCGLTRGAEATAQDQGTWAGTTGGAVATAPPLWRRLIGFWWIPAILVALVVGYLTSAQRGSDGSLTTAGTVDVTELRIGDCFNSDEETEIAEVDGVPCDEAHEFEIFAVDTYQADALPGAAQMDAVFLSVCNEPFQAYVGSPYESSEIYASMITPSEDSWADGDRTFMCVLYDPENDQLTESMRGAER